MTLRDNPGAAISGGLHALLLAAMLLSFSRAARFDDAQESIPVDMVSDQEFSQIMKGEKTAAKRDKPALKVENLAEIEEPKPQSALPPAKVEAPAPQPRAMRAEDPGLDEARTPPVPPPRPADDLPKPQLKAEPAKPGAAAAPPPVASPDAGEPKPAPKPKAEPKKVSVEAKPKPVEPPKKPEPKFKPDEVAKLLDREKPKEQPPKQAPKSGDERAEPTDKFDLSDINRFLNKEAPQRKASTGRELQQVASLGAPTASASKMSPSLWNALDGLLQDQYRHCWSYIGIGGQQKYIPQIHVQYTQDGALIGQPELLNPPSDPNLRSLADSALRAVRRCNPLRIPAQYQPYYDQWKARIVRFDPEDML
jgi:colicin import membrane protein